jgi:membrane protein
MNRDKMFISKRFWWAMHLGGLSVRAVGVKTWTRINDHAVLSRAAAIAFYAVAALIPFMALLIALTARWLPWIVMQLGGDGPFDPLDPFRDLLPADAASFLTRELSRLQRLPPTAVISFGLVALLWLSSSLFVEIIDAMNVISGVAETRPFWKRRLIAIVMTLSQAAILIAAVVSIIAWPQILAWLGLSRPAAILATTFHGATVFSTVLSSFALALYVAPDSNRRWEWITPGSLLGTLVLLATSLVFRIYTQNWANYSATYGSLAGMIVLMSWIWISSVVLLVSAELNQVIEDSSYRHRREMPTSFHLHSVSSD